MTKVITGDLIWSYLAFFINIAFGIILLPFLLKYLTIQELGLWYIFNTISSFVNLLDFGFSTSISRNISYAWGGANFLSKYGINYNKIDDNPNQILIGQIILISKKIYNLISFLSFIFLIIFGSIYIESISKNIDNHLLAWLIYSFSIFINIRVSYRIPVLKGIGKIKDSQKSIVLSKTLQLLITIFGLIMNQKLIAISVASLLNGFLLQYLSNFFLKKNLSTCFQNNIFTKEKYNIDIFKNIWFNSKKSGMVSLGAFFITQSTLLLSSYFLDLKITAQYGFTLQLVNIIITLSSTYYLINLPNLSIAMLNKNHNNIRDIISNGCIVNWFLYIIGSFLLIFLTPILVKSFNFKINILDYKYLFFMLFYLFLENNHSMFASYISCENKIPFVNSSIYSGFLIFILSIILLKFTNLGILGMMFSQFFVQLSYNNWKWPSYIFKNYKISVLKICKVGFFNLFYDKPNISKSYNCNSNF